jgi:DNA-directed RNA polymerase alpha subunit
LRNLGDTSLEEIEAKLREHSLQLGMRLPAGAEA